jgi:hypothetical protein
VGALRTCSGNAKEQPCDAHDDEKSMSPKTFRRQENPHKSPTPVIRHPARCRGDVARHAWRARPHVEVVLLLPGRRRGAVELHVEERLNRGIGTLDNPKRQELAKTLLSCISMLI